MNCHSIRKPRSERLGGFKGDNDAFRIGHLNAELIEGEDNRLKNTRAAVVRGGRVHIGKGCSIGRRNIRRLSAHIP
ncbi:hypothetical protein [Paenibacillus lautus]|uniref:hypothetical protein n=1 Tax=Paenibacillus lautus TaxID=1401 RepID=UPI003D2BA68C